MTRQRPGASAMKIATPNWRMKSHLTMGSDLAHRVRGAFTAITTEPERRALVRTYRWVAGRQHAIALILILTGATAIGMDLLV